MAKAAEHETEIVIEASARKSRPMTIEKYQLEMTRLIGAAQDAARRFITAPRAQQARAHLVATLADLIALDPNPEN